MTETSEEERERWALYAVPLTHEELLRLLADADQCAAYERVYGAVAAELEGDGTDKLCQALYGRPPQAQDYLGGSGARMLHDAAARIVELERQIGLEGNAYERELRLLRERCAELEAEVRRLTELWMDAVEHLAERNSNGRVTASYPISRDVIHELEKRGLAEGNERDGWVLKRPGEGES